MTKDSKSAIQIFFDLQHQKGKKQNRLSENLYFLFQYLVSIVS